MIDRNLLQTTQRSFDLNGCVAVKLMVKCALNIGLKPGPNRVRHQWFVSSVVCVINSNEFSERIDIDQGRR